MSAVVEWLGIILYSTTRNCVEIAFKITVHPVSIITSDSSIITCAVILADSVTDIFILANINDQVKINAVGV